MFEEIQRRHQPFCLKAVAASRRGGPNFHGYYSVPGFVGVDVWITSNRRGEKAVVDILPFQRHRGAGGGAAPERLKEEMICSEECGPLVVSLVKRRRN